MTDSTIPLLDPLVIEQLALEHEASGGGAAGPVSGFSCHFFDASGTESFTRALEAKIREPLLARISQLEQTVAADHADAEEWREQKSFLLPFLRMWKDEGLSAPVNELQSISAWLYKSCDGLEPLKSAMRARMLLLMRAADQLNDEGLEAEIKAGIYDNRPDMIPGIEPPLQKPATPKEAQLLKDLKANLQTAPTEQLDACMQPLIEKWEATPTALQILEVLDHCIHSSLASGLVIELLQRTYETACTVEGLTNNEVVKQAHWRQS